MAHPLFAKARQSVSERAHATGFQVFVKHNRGRDAFSSKVYKTRGEATAFMEEEKKYYPDAEFTLRSV